MSKFKIIFNVLVLFLHCQFKILIFNCVFRKNTHSFLLLKKIILSVANEQIITQNFKFSQRRISLHHCL